VQHLDTSKCCRRIRWWRFGAELLEFRCKDNHQAGPQQNSGESVQCGLSFRHYETQEIAAAAATVNISESFNKIHATALPLATDLQFIADFDS
jgi:hypothetical protein